MRRQGICVKKIGPKGTQFVLNGTTYRPDFYDKKHKIFYEVSGTRKAYHSGKKKYQMFRTLYPNLTLKIVKPDGTPIPVEP